MTLATYIYNIQATSVTIHPCRQESRRQHGIRNNAGIAEEAVQGKENVRFHDAVWMGSGVYASWRLGQL